MWLGRGVLSADAGITLNFPLSALRKMVENNWLGDKTGQGFYKKTKDEKGKTVILSLDLHTFEYRAAERVNFETLDRSKAIDNLADRFALLLAGKDLAGEFYRKTILDGFRYASNRIPEIADDLVKIDQAICAGFGWEMGIFETWDAIGVQNGIELMAAEGHTPAAWVNEMVQAGHTSFYRVENGERQYYDIHQKKYLTIPGSNKQINLQILKPTNTIYKNDDASIIDIGDGIINLEFHSKMNTMGQGVLEGIQKALDLAEKDYRGLVIGNEGVEAFSAGANLGMLFMYAAQQEFDEALAIGKAEIMTVAIETSKRAVFIERQACADVVNNLADAEDEGAVSAALRDAAEAILNRISMHRM